MCIVKQTSQILDSLYNLWQNPEDYDIEDFLGLMQDISDYTSKLVNEAKDNPYYGKLFNNALKDMKVELEYCPECKEPTKLSTYIEREYHNELTEFGHTPYEEFHRKYCEQCGWSKY